MKSIKKYTSLILFALSPMAGFSQTPGVSAESHQSLLFDQSLILILSIIAFLVLLIYVLGKSTVALANAVIQKNKKTLVLIPFLIAAAGLHAQETGPSKLPEWIFNQDTYILGFIFSMIVLTLYALFQANTSLIKILNPKTEPAVKTILSARPSFVKRIYERMLDSVPVAKEKDILLDHDYDGIQELDNNLPPWWKYGFYLTIVFAVVYLFSYHISGTGKLQKEEYREELVIAEMQKQERLKASADNINEENVTALTDMSRISNGKENFGKLCAACHRGDGGGQVGPNLTDDYWLHGGGIKNIFKTITYGVPDKGMIKWSSQLAPKQIQEIASFILTLHNSKPEGGKEPQGEIYTPEEPLKDSTAVVKKDSSVVETKILTLKN
jgi:cytochrome c oxidase cbb3-type subunit 3